MLGEYYKDKQGYHKIGGCRMQGIRTLLGEYGGTTLLDVGCGEGALGVALKKDADCSVYGVDISTSAVERARSVLDGAFVYDLERDRMPDELLAHVYDTIVCSEVLEHLFEPEKVLERIHTMVTANSRVILTVPNVLFWKNRLRILLGHFEYTDIGLMDRGHIHFFSWRSFQDTVHEAGFTIEKTAHCAPTRGTQKLVHRFPGLFAKQFIVQVRKQA